MHAFYAITAMDGSPRQPEQSNKQPARPGRMYAVLKFSSVGIEMGVAVGIGLGLGYWLDLQFDSSPVLLLVGLALGIAAGFLGVFRAAREAEQLMEAENREAGGPGAEAGRGGGESK